jgi:hypothetical protein
MGHDTSWETNNRSDNIEIPNFYGTRGFITVLTRAPTEPCLNSDKSSHYLHNLFLPNLTFTFRRLGHSKISIHVRGPV